MDEREYRQQVAELRAAIVAGCDGDLDLLELAESVITRLTSQLHPEGHREAHLAAMRSVLEHVRDGQLSRGDWPR